MHTVADLLKKQQSLRFIFRLASNSQSLISLLSGLTMTEEDKVMMRTMEALNMLLENVLDKLEAKKGKDGLQCLKVFVTIKK